MLCRITVIVRPQYNGSLTGHCLIIIMEHKNSLSLTTSGVSEIDLTSRLKGLLNNQQHIRKERAVEGGGEGWGRKDRGGGDRRMRGGQRGRPRAKLISFNETAT